MKDATIALAAVYQAVGMAHELAASGSIRDEKYLQASLRSLYQFNPTTTEAVFDNDLSGLKLGLQTLQQALAKKGNYINNTKAALTLLTLQNQLKTSLKMRELIGNKLKGSRIMQTEQQPFNHNVINKLAEIYSQTISQMQPRVIVAGQPFHLKNTTVTEQIRAILLAGIRAAVLWRQVGGTQIQLLFKRKKYAEITAELLKPII